MVSAFFSPRWLLRKKAYVDSFYQSPSTMTFNSDNTWQNHCKYYPSYNCILPECQIEGQEGMCNREHQTGN